MNTNWTGTIREKRPAVANRIRTTTITSALFSFLFVITAGNPIQAADPASRFLNITAWTGNFKRTAHDAGNRRHDDCNTQWTINHSVDITTRMPLDPGTINIPNFRLWIDAGNHTASVKIDEDATETCVNPDGNTVIFGWTARTDPSHSPEGFELVIDTQAGTYTMLFDVGTDIVTDNTFVVDGTPMMSRSSVKFSPENTFTNPLPASGFLLSGSRKFHLNSCDCLSSFLPMVVPYLTADVEVSWSLAPADFEDLEVVVTAEDTGHNEDYDKWLPRGKLQDWHQPGSLLNLVALLRKTNGAPTTFTANQFIFELSEVSHEPGVCMNRPIKQSANTDPDLKFDELFNRPPFVPTPVLIRSAFRAETVPFPVPSTRGEVILSCYDFGAYGVLRVTADVGGLQIPGYIKNDPAKKTKILLPKRKEDSHIADFWKEDKGVDNLPDTDDEENDPEGDKHPGDGLTLYEEYRGFSENLKHVRANPKKKDLFIADTINNWRSKNGIALFTSKAGLEVHHQLQAAELSSRADLTDRWVNFNTNNDTPHVVDQHGLLLEVWPTNFSEAVSISEFAYKNSTPASIEVIFVYPAITAPSTAPLRKEDIDGINTVRRNGLTYFTDNAQSTTAHELAHGCSVWHHGECDKKPEWTIALNLNRTPPPYIVSEQGGLNIVLKKEPNAVLLSAPFFGTKNIWLGMPQGQHSGVEDCIMRYNSAFAYPQGNSLVRFWVMRDEMTGLSFCKTPTGTGVNLAGRVPQSRYGDAANGRGNCKGQICVNDLYLRHPLHNRKIICP